MCYDVTLCHRHDWDVQMQLHPDCTAMTTFRPDATLLLQLLRWSSAHAPLGPPLGLSDEAILPLLLGVETRGARTSAGSSAASPSAASRTSARRREGLLQGLLQGLHL